MNDKNRFDSKTGPGSNGCVVWRAYKNRGGYGVFSYQGKTELAHHCAVFFNTGVFPRYVMHICDNPACVNVSHLVVGTHQENVADMVSKGRHAVGARTGTAKLTDQDVISMRNTYHSGSASVRELASRFGISRSTAWLAVSGKRWRHLP